MTIKSMFFNAVQNGNTYDRVYSAEDFSGYLDKIVGDGVFASPSVNLQVIANNPATMAVYVHAGQGWIQGHKFISSEAIGITIPAAHGTSARVDSVNFYLDYEEREMGVRIVTGTPGSSNPTALVQTNTFWEYRLAKITVGAGATSISQSNITDRRGTPECPFVAGLIDEIDAESLFAQWDDQFNDWLVGVQEQLSEIGSFVSGIRRLEAVYNTSASSTVSSFNVTTYIPEYSAVTDCLELFINGLKLTTEEYTLSGTTVTLSGAIVQKSVPIDIVVWHVDAAGDNYIASIKLGGLPLTPDANKSVNIPVDDTLSRSRQPADANRTGYELLKKVDKVEGKGLSTNDFSNTYKTKVDGIEDGAEVNVIEEIKVDGVALTPDGNRAVNIPVDDTLEEASTPADSKAVGDAIADLEERKTNPDGYYEGMTVGNALQLVGTQGVIDKDPYNFRRTGYPNDVGNRVYDEIVGGSIVWNQLVDSGATEVTVPNGHKYYANINGAKSIGASTGTSISINDSTKDNVIDLTAALTPTIADYVYSLETATAGAGVAWFKKYFPGIYYGYAEPHFEHVQTSAKETIGFNQWDEVWEVGSYSSSTGEVWNTTDRIRSKPSNYIDVLPNTVYCIYSEEWGSGAGKYFGVLFYDGEKTFLSYVDVSNGLTFTTPSNARYVRFSAQPSYGTTYKNDICLNIHGDRDGEYEAYRKRTYPIEPKVLRGVLQLDSANRPYFDGDVMRHDGSGEQRYKEMTLNGSENWTLFTGIGVNQFYINQSDVRNVAGRVCMMCDKYPTINISDRGNGYGVGYTGAGTICFNIDPTQYADVASWKSYLTVHPITVVYLCTPEPFTAEPYQYPMVVDPLGTERFVDYAFEQGDRDVEIPVGHTSDYPPNLRDKLQNLPSLSSDGDGRYIIVQTGNQMVLSPDTSAGLIAALEARVAALEGGN